MKKRNIEKRHIPLNPPYKGGNSLARGGFKSSENSSPVLKDTTNNCIYPPLEGAGGGKKLLLKNTFNFRTIALFSILFLFLYSCSQDPTRILPNRNLDKIKATQDSINTTINEVAPYQRVLEDDCSDAFYREQRGDIGTSKINIIKPGNAFFRELLGSQFVGKEQVIDELTAKFESVAFLTRNSGIVAISHPPDDNYSKLINLPMAGNVGGTDLMSFNLDDGKFKFQAFSEPINSIFWDSHPWIGQDSLCNYVLIWASDRNNPYSRTKGKNDEIINNGNSDLFYSFRINGEWSLPDTLSFDKKVNTEKHNEISPFVTCMSISPKLLFSSNRDGDYDIYSADIQFNFNNKKIEVINEPIKFEKGSQFDFQNDYINTDANEMFPFVAFPYLQNSNSKELFYASDRNRIERPFNQAGDTLVINKGQYDLYTFNIDMECKIPTPPPPPPPIKDNIRLHLTVIDKLGNPIEKPLLLIYEDKMKDSNLVYDESKIIQLEKGKNYKFYGGSEKYNIDCNQSKDSIVQYYRGTKFIFNPPTIKKREVKTNYDSIINPTLMVAYDTSFVTELVPLTSQILKSEVIEIVDSSRTDQKLTESAKVTDFRIVNCLPEKNENKIHKVDDGLPSLQQIETPRIETNITYAEVDKMIIKKREWYEGGKIIVKTKVDIFYDTIPNIDTISVTVAGANIPSKNTSFKWLNIDNLKGDVILYDTVTLDPVYFVKPECEVEFVDIKSEYNKNVPYFQTAFWKVNTSYGLEQHLQDFKEGGYLERAGYLELHPKHRKYGYFYEAARRQRMREYREYASQVDGNLRVMRNVITDEFIPNLELISKFAPETKLLLKLEAYSDRRDASVCYYIGNTVEYLQGKENPDGSILLSNEKITNNATLSNNNENLSKLRVFNGFRELFDRLKMNPKFVEYLNKGLVFYPTMKFNSDEERDAALEKAKIIILAEGKFYDQSVMENEEDYDPIRRLNLVIKMIQFNAGRIIPSDCCK